MQTHNRNTFTTIHTEGALLPIDLLQHIRANDPSLEGLTPESYHLAPGEKLNEAINRSWNRLNGLWGAFQAARVRLGEGDAGTTLTRERWLLPLFQELGFGRLSTSKAVEIEGKSYPISHRWQNVPIHLIGCGLQLDKRTPGVAGASRTSPHSLLQEYLNRSDESQWGLLANGLSLRVLRDNATLTRQAYIEFDLESMFDGEVYSDFVLLWLVCHQSPFETAEKQTDCILERWSKSAQASGTRALDDLRSGVEGAIVSLGQGFLLHPLNGELRNKLKKGDLPTQEYYRQLLRLVYRLIFLFAAEDRELLLLPTAPAQAKQRFQSYYSTARLRSLSQHQRGSRHYDRYEALQLVMTLLGSDKGCPELAIPALGGFLFDARSTADLNEAKLDNQALLTAVRSLAFISQGKIRRAVDYRNLGPEELGSVYESLLELHPLLNTDAGTFELTSAAGNERKTTGSYYTPSSLIQVLLDSALDPVIEDRVKASGNSPIQQEEALLSLKVCDPACGSGHFLIAAAHRIAGKLAQIRNGGDEPSPDENRLALRDVIRHCIYGVDINPMAVELCKVNLWLESLEPGKPLSFLDAHIKCGNSLVGVGPKMSLDDLEVPDEAFNPVTGDHKATATLLKKRNKQEREGQESLFVTVVETKEDLNKWLAERTRIVEAMPEENAAEVQAKAEAYQKVNESAEYRKQCQIADLWTAAFFWKIEEPKSATYEVVAPTHGQLRRLRSGGQTQPGLLDQVKKLSQSEEFFHWPLEFVEVAVLGGFDCVLGNPPWERIKLQEQEFFSLLDPKIAAAPGKSARNVLIEMLPNKNPGLWSLFEDAKAASEDINGFLRFGSRFHPGDGGDINTYFIFTELSSQLISSNGVASVIVPTGIATDDLNKEFFAELMRSKRLLWLYDFENRDGLFLGVHRSYRFCVLAINGKSISGDNDPIFAFFLSQPAQIKDKIRSFSLNYFELQKLNPNTITCPIFITSFDAELTKKINNRFPVLLNEKTSENPWEISIRRVFDMGSPSDIRMCISKFEYQRIAEIGLNHLLPMYEAKMISLYDHRFGTYAGVENRDNIHLIKSTLENYENNSYYVSPWYYLRREHVLDRLDDWKYTWFIGFRNITRATNERTVITSIIPISATDKTLRIIFSKKPLNLLPCLLGNFNSLIFDYLSRQFLSGMNLSNYVTYQLSIIPPNYYKIEDINFITTRIIELVYTANDLQSFAYDVGYHGEPFKWDEDRRALLRAELDAYYAKLYGLSRDELRYILDPQDVYGPDFPGETFRVLKEKEIRQFGEYRTRRLVLEAWDRLEASGELPKGVQGESVIEVPTRVEVPEPQHPVTPMPQLVKPADKREPKPAPNDDAQPSLGDMVLYNCAACGKMVMGFDRGNHEREKHGGQSVEWKRVG